LRQLGAATKGRKAGRPSRRGSGRGSGFLLRKRLL
jgi:hypothetical protein